MQHHQEELQKRIQQVQAEERALKEQLAVQQFAANYPFQLQWPAVIQGNQRTDPDIIQHRLLEAGLLYEIPIKTGDAVEAASRFVANLEESDCFHNISVQIGGPEQKHPRGTQYAAVDLNGSNSQPTAKKQQNERSIHVTLQEKNWYRLHAGAGLKTDFMGTNQHAHTQIATNSFLPAAECEASAGLRNVLGVLDHTDLQYVVDTHQIGTWTLTHNRPLYSVLPEPFSDSLLESANGSQFHFTAKAALDTVDHELVSSYKEYQRLVTIKAATSNKPIASPFYASLEWSLHYKDFIPMRHATLPYHIAASPEIVAAAGASVKHAVTAHVKYNSMHRIHQSHTEEEIDRSGMPVSGIQVECTTQIATPPGDVGFVKGQVSIATHRHIPATPLVLHGSLSTGYLHALSFMGICQSPGPSDRFLLGGTGSFRGFVPAGIGPRSMQGKDALGGNVYYTASLSASTRPPTTLASSIVPKMSAVASHVRLFGFLTAGTCANGSIKDTVDLFRSTRVAAGFGIATQILGPRLEATYAWPLRYGPRDGRRKLQFGVSMSI